MRAELVIVIRTTLITAVVFFISIATAILISKGETTRLRAERCGYQSDVCIGGFVSWADDRISKIEYCDGPCAAYSIEARDVAALQYRPIIELSRIKIIYRTEQNAIEAKRTHFAEMFPKTHTTN